MDHHKWDSRIVASLVKLVRSRVIEEPARHLTDRSFKGTAARPQSPFRESGCHIIKLEKRGSPWKKVHPACQDKINTR
jgi:hypothetical protein